MIERIFSLDDMIGLPNHLVFREVDGNVLILAPEKPNWIVTNYTGREIINNLVESKTIRESMLIAAKKLQVSDEEIIEHTKKLLTDIEEYKFYESTQPIDLDESSPPTRLQLYLTNRCNLRCVHCYMNSSESLNNELSSEEWKNLIKDFNSIVGPTLVAFSGGEPLVLGKDFTRIAEFTKNKDNTTFLFTNGTLITKRNIEDLVNYMDKIQVSIDGTTEEAHDSVRGDGSFRRTLKGLNLLRGKNVEVIISYCVVPENIDDLRNNFIDFIESLKIDDIKVGISVARKIGRWKYNCQGCRDYSLGEFYHRLEDVLLEIYSRGWDTPSSNRNFIKRNCTFGQRFVVGAEGDVYPCAETVYNIGNVRKESTEILYEKLKRINRDSSTDKTEVCSPCDLKYICRGGCKTARAQSYGTPFKQKCGEDRKELICKKLIGKTII